MAKEIVAISIIGHVDHGKSTLIGRLILDTGSLPDGRMAELKKIARELGKDTELAYFTDQLIEEREEDRTIDTTQAYFKTRKRNYVIIDVPGHVEFINNMITGATHTDTTFLIIDVRAGIEEQTRRHIYIANMLGIRSEFVVFNKMDLADYSEAKFLKLKNEFLALSSSLGMPPSFIIPVSAKDGENITRRSAKMRWYKGPCLVDAFDSLKISRGASKKPLRFPVQDVYTVDGEKIAVGKIASGTIRREQGITISPGFQKARVTAIKTFGKTLREASAGENVGLVLDNMDLIRRGMVLSGERSQPAPTDHFRASIFWMSDKPLETGKPLTLRCATQEVECVARDIEERIDSSTFKTIERGGTTLGLNEVGVVTFNTKKPVIVEKFGFIEELGRFIIESGHELRAAGIITTPPRQNHIS